MFSRKRLLINDLFNHYADYLEKNVKVCGWIETMRIQKVNGIAFISLTDGSSVQTLQIILDPHGDEELEKLGTIYSDGTKGVSIEVFGKVVESPAKGQKIEIKCETIKVLGKVNARNTLLLKRNYHWII